MVKPISRRILRKDIELEDGLPIVCMRGGRRKHVNAGKVDAGSQKDGEQKGREDTEKVRNGNSVTAKVVVGSGLVKILSKREVRVLWKKENERGKLHVLEAFFFNMKKELVNLGNMNPNR
ncbi:hypothetical protein PIB30_054615 [Stylosanthes scabra]|uniref:Uncharacterized protein n=1 Tax=Stylosanthes scabra TaxID=79078 RepID=A0ABU6SIS2_9FABA|nr:hypothetical protein [Stylosanthes scabra]